MFGEKMKKAISVALIFGMVLTGNGFTTLASSVDDLVTDAAIKSEQEEQKNYYKLMYEEKYYEQTTTLLNTNASDEKSSEKGEEDSSEKLEDKNQNEEKTDSEITEPEVPDDDSDDSGNKSSYDEEPEDDETTKANNEEDEETTTVEQSTESFDEKETTIDEEETTTVEPTTESSDENQTTTDNIDETTTTIESQETETGEVETSETETIVETSEVESTTETSETETTAETSEVESVEEETTETVASESDATVVDGETDDEKATESEATEEKAIIATTSDFIDAIEDLKSTASEIEFKDEVDVATASTATKSVIKVVKYIVATRSKIATTSIWRVKDFLIDEDFGSFNGLIPTEEEMNQKYLPKKVRVLVEDQLGNQRVIEINAKWDRIRVNQQSGRRVDTTPKATRAYIPNKLQSAGLMVDVDHGTFDEKTVNVAENAENEKYDEQVKKGISDYYDELNRLNGNADDNAEETDELDETTDDKMESVETEDAKAETLETETTETETIETETEKEIETETTEVIIIEETTIEELTEPTVAGFVLSESGGEGTEETTTEATTEAPTEAPTEASTEASEDVNSEEKAKEEAEEGAEEGDEITVVENGNDAEIVDGYEIETVYEDSKIELVSGQDLINDKGLQGNIANGVVNPDDANFAVGGELNFDAAMEELAEELGDDSVVFLPKRKPVQLTAYGDGLLGAGPGGTHAAHIDNRVSNITGIGPIFNVSQQYVIASDSDLVDYAKDSAKNGWLLSLANDITVVKDIDFKKQKFYMCLNGKKLIFAEVENTKTNIYSPGRITNSGSIVISDHNDTAPGIITGLNQATKVPYDRRYLSAVSNTYKSVSAIEGKGDYCILSRISVQDIWSNVHDKIQFTGYDDDAAAFIRATASEVQILGATAMNLVGAQGGLMKVTEVTKAVIKDCYFYDNKAFMGACFNLKFKDVISKTQGTTKGLEISNNTFKRNAYAFFDYDDENPYTFGRYPYEKQSYYKVSDIGIFNEKITSSNFNDTDDGGTAQSTGYKAADQTKPRYGLRKTDLGYVYQYQNVGYEKTTYNYDGYVTNGIILIDNVGIPETDGETLTIDINDNIIADNMPYDLCGTFHLALNNVLTDGINGNKYKNKVKINVYKNTIRNNCQYKSSKNEGDVAAGMTISVAPWSYAKHVDITYEDAYKMGTNSEAIPYKKAI